nr:hypothetical protein [Streptomyces sp. C8S0]
MPHAYLAGLGVEIMASSDNVLRCGLTSKHVDAVELAAVVAFEAPPPRVLVPREGAAGEQVYPAPVDDFRLSRLRPRPGSRRCSSRAAHPRSCCARRAVHGPRGRTAPCRSGPGSAYVPAAEGVRVTGDGTVFRATVGLPPAASEQAPARGTGNETGDRT